MSVIRVWQLYPRDQPFSAFLGDQGVWECRIHVGKPRCDATLGKIRMYPVNRLTGLLHDFRRPNWAIQPSFSATQQCIAQVNRDQHVGVEERGKHVLVALAYPGEFDLVILGGVIIEIVLHGHARHFVERVTLFGLPPTLEREQIGQPYPAVA